MDTDEEWFVFRAGIHLAANGLGCSRTLGNFRETRRLFNHSAQISATEMPELWMVNLCIDKRA